VDERGEGPQDDPLRAALAEYLAIPGMRAALLVSDQGLVISRATREGVDTASIAALAIDTVSTVQRFGIQVQAGYLDAMRIEFDKLTVVLAPFAPDVMLALVATAGSLGAMSKDLTAVRSGGAAGTKLTTPNTPEDQRSF
jgi:predicted regulator of Ras-like GTPase activity (Roadblock/LC7/MglB family)